MSRTISVFEHGTLRVEKGDLACRLTAREFDALVRFNDEREGRVFRVGYNAIHFLQYVGYLQVGDLGIEILPKPDQRQAQGDEHVQWREMLIEMLKVGLGVDLGLSDTSSQALERPSLIELVVGHFLSRVEQIGHEGLARGYREEESNGSTFRGRLLFAEQVRHNHSRADRCYVRYQVYDRDILVNRLLRTALEVASRMAISAPLRARVLANLPKFEAARPIEPKPDTFDRLVLARSTERYRDALILARMLLEELAPALRRGKVPVFSLLFDMNILWERYVGVLFQRVRSPGIRVTRQDKRTFWTPEASHGRIIRPDIVVSDERSSKVLAVLDTKWKLAKAKGPDDDDLKQMFAYNEVFAASRAFLLYPTTGTTAVGMTGTFSARGHQCSTVGLMLQHRGRARTAAILQQVRQLVELVRPSLSAKATTPRQPTDRSSARSTASQ